MKLAVFAIGFALMTTTAFAQGRGGGGGAAGGAAGTARPAGAGQPSVAPGSGPVITPGGLVQPGVATSPGTIMPGGTMVAPGVGPVITPGGILQPTVSIPSVAGTPGGTVVAPGVTVAPGVVVPGFSATTNTVDTLRPGVGQPLSPVSPSTMMGTQLGAGGSSQTRPFSAEPGGQNTPGTLPQPEPVTGGGSATTAPTGFGAATSGPTAASPSAANASTTPGTAQMPSAPAVLIPAPSIAPSGATGPDMIPAGALGVVVESMMLANVVDVDRERSCITLKTADRTVASYRVTPHGRNVEVGDQLVIKMQRPLFAPAGDTPSASPPMSERDAVTRTRRLAMNTDAATSQSATRTVISPICNAATVISSGAERCPTR